MKIIKYEQILRGICYFKHEVSHINQVVESMSLSRFALSLQWERAAISLVIFLDAKTEKGTDLSKEYDVTDEALQAVEWRRFGTEKVFDNPLRFQIRIDDFR